MSSPERLPAVADATRQAVAGTLEDLAAGIADVSAPELLAAGGDALSGCEAPAVLAHAAAADGVTGPALVALTAPGARRLAALLGAIDEEEAEFGGGDVGDRELSAVREVTAKLTAAIASAITGVVDREAGFAPAGMRVVDADGDVRLTVDGGLRAVVVRFTLLGEPGRAVVLLPDALVAETVPGVSLPDAEPAVTDMPLGDALRNVNVRVWAELGRARMPTGDVVGLPSGAIVELDRDAEEAIELYVDGQLYASGRLVVTDDDSWGVRIERILAAR